MQFRRRFSGEVRVAWPTPGNDVPEASALSGGPLSVKGQVELKLMLSLPIL